MAVPKKKTSKSRKGMRRAHHAIKTVNAVIDKTTGEYRLSHHIGDDGMYNNRTTLIQSVKNTSPE